MEQVRRGIGPQAPVSAQDKVRAGRGKTLELSRHGSSAPPDAEDSADKLPALRHHRSKQRGAEARHSENVDEFVGGKAGVCDPTA